MNFRVKGRYIGVLVAVLAIGMNSIACGAENSNSDDSPDNSGNIATESQSKSDNSMIMANDSIYAIDDFTSVGYKAVTQFELDTLPEANDAWYGFYDQKDFELRFYESHEAALNHGVEPAEIAVGKKSAPWIKQPPIRFDAYAVVGNVVMLCEFELESCETLAAQLLD